ncbi:probable ubiquitin-conjugating enzyme E2 W-A [Rhopalosiphum padi]|uniref:probable ubiquitin-conjugating enzyme E2 W-A n=1 Tax=Rhopalosiphum padi TaxID=40932 RepID=UPI00298DEE07|nr:probable ubiquitin-conjugating enzyme E2 W-A [Rhopalosiphum padi]
MAGIAPYKRKLQKEMASFIKDPPFGMVLDVTKAEENINIWTILMQGLEDTLYAEEQFQLQFKFGSNYPFEPPEVTFVGQNIPVHPHIYSNGHICLSILADDWSPALSIHSICVSILSMLSSCKEKKRPDSDRSYLQLSIDNPKEVKWFFHDEDI